RGAGARFVFNEYLLSQTFGQLLRDDAHRTVDGTARRKRHDDAHGPRRVILCMKDGAAERDRKREREAKRRHARASAARGRTSTASANERHGAFNCAARAAPRRGSTRPRNWRWRSTSLIASSRL